MFLLFLAMFRTMQTKVQESSRKNNMTYWIRVIVNSKHMNGTLPASPISIAKTIFGFFTIMKRGTGKFLSTQSQVSFMMLATVETAI